LFGFFFALSCVQSESGSRMGEGKQRYCSGPWDEGAGGVHKGYFHIPAGMVVSGEGSPYANRRYICLVSEKAVHMPIGVTYVTEK